MRRIKEFFEGIDIAYELVVPIVCGAIGGVIGTVVIRLLLR